MAKALFLLALALSSAAAAPVIAQKPDDQIAPVSVQFQQRGEAAMLSGNLTGAADVLETALAVDPRNRAAFIDLARVSTRQKLFGKAIRFTNKALALEPNDRDALAVQGVAMVELGATPRAQQNLAKLQTLCGKTCPQVSELGAAITRGPSPVPVKSTSAASPKKN
ncbi:MAG: tetratricopeptide repeat protein [Sphingomicrobium sp.]